jgi:hypothetical protein
VLHHNIIIMPNANLLFPPICVCLSTEIQNIFKSENIAIKCDSGHQNLKWILQK